MAIIQLIFGFVGRAALSLIFILAAIDKIMHIRGSEQILINQLCDLMGYTHSIQWMREGVDAILPWTFVIVGMSVVIELLFGSMLFLGIQARFAALMLMIFLIPSTLLFHHFWFLQGQERELQMILFLKNLAIFGGLATVVAYGTGNSPAKKENK